MEKQDGQQNLESRLQWEVPRLKLVGNLECIVRGGGGKLSAISPDAGDPRKPSGQG